jgi:hypothetical protein
VLNEGGLQKIDDDAFSGCTSLERIAIPSVVQWREDDEMFSSYAYKCVIGDIFSEIERRVSHYEMKEATTIYELALWKGYLNQAKSEVTNRYDYCAEVPKEVKYSILEYLKY